MNLLSLFKSAGNAWKEDKAARLGAALSYYAVFSLAPLLIIMLALAGLVYQETEAQTYLVNQVAATISPDVANLIKNMLTQVGATTKSQWALAISAITIILGALGLFQQLKDAVNDIWHTTSQSNDIMGTIRERGLLFLLVLGTGFMLIVSLVASTLITSLGITISSKLGIPALALQALTLALSFLILSILFAALFRFLPDTKVPWNHALIAGALTSLLFNLGKQLLSTYVGNAASSSGYGAAGSLIALLLWVYYASQLFLFGVEISKVLTTAPSKPLTQAPIHKPRPSTYIIIGLALTYAAIHAYQEKR